MDKERSRHFRCTNGFELERRRQRGVASIRDALISTNPARAPLALGEPPCKDRPGCRVTSAARDAHMTIDPRALEYFRQAHSGDVIAPGHDRYEQARRVWNAMIDRRPA